MALPVFALSSVQPPPPPSFSPVPISRHSQAHQGTADHGHYYSLIRADGDRWLEFNDRRVTAYDPSNIPRDCFGGGVAPEVRCVCAHAFVRLFDHTAVCLGEERYLVGVAVVVAAGWGGGGGEACIYARARLKQRVDSTSRLDP